MFESHSEIKDFDPEKKGMRENSGIFESIEDPAEEQKYIDSYDNILANKEFFIGSGNNAIVYDATLESGEKTEKCIKAIWSKAFASIKDNEIYKLPETGRKIRQVEEYFQIIKEKKRRKIKSGKEFMVQVSPEEEATYSNRGHFILNNGESGVTIPRIEHLIHIEREDDELDRPKDPYNFGEDVNLLVMEKVDGINIEELILNRGKHLEFPEKIDFKSFKIKLEKAIVELGEHGLYHNDISTRNIMVSYEGEPVLIDFGAAKQFPKSRPDGVSLKENLKMLDKTLDWLRKFLNNQEETQDELRNNIDKVN